MTEREPENSDLKLINYRLTEIDKQLGNISRTIENNDERYLTRREHDDFLKGILIRIGELEDTNKWLNRTVIGVVILAVLGTVIITR